MAIGPDEFVSIVRSVVYESSIRSVVEVLRSPPGRSPAAELRSASTWYGQLGPSDRANVEWIIEESSRVALFGVLALLDGARAHSNDPDSSFELSEVSHEGRLMICPAPGPFLHDRFNVEVPPSHQRTNRP